MRHKNQPAVKAPLSVRLTDSPAARLLRAPGVKWRETAAPVSGRGFHTEWDRNRTDRRWLTPSERDAHKAALTPNNPGATLNPAVPCIARSSALGVRGASASLARWLSTCRMPRTLGARSRSAGRMCSTRTVRPQSVVRRRGVMRGWARGAVYADGDRGAGVVPQIAANDGGRRPKAPLQSDAVAAATSGALVAAALAPSARGDPRGNSLLRRSQRYRTPSSTSSR